jgi:hypothetical protein
VNCRRLFPQAEFISAEEVKWKGAPKGLSALLGEGFAVIDVGNDGKIADVLLLHILSFRKNQIMSKANCLK